MLLCHLVCVGAACFFEESPGLAYWEGKNADAIGIRPVHAECTVVNGPAFAACEVSSRAAAVRPRPSEGPLTISFSFPF